MAIITGLLAKLDEHRLLEPPKKGDPPSTSYKVHVLEAINSAGLRGSAYTWDGVRKASTNLLFPSASLLLPSRTLPCKKTNTLPLP
jgi:hypothetical protein